MFSRYLNNSSLETCFVYRESIESLIYSFFKREHLIYAYKHTYVDGTIKIYFFFQVLLFNECTCDHVT